MWNIKKDEAKLITKGDLYWKVIWGSWYACSSLYEQVKKKKEAWSDSNLENANGVDEINLVTSGLVLEIYLKSG